MGTPGNTPGAWYMIPSKKPLIFYIGVVPGSGLLVVFAGPVAWPGKGFPERNSLSTGSWLDRNNP